MSKTLKKSILLVIIALGILFLGGTTVNATTTFESYLDEEGRFVVNAIKPTSMKELWNIFEILYMPSEGEPTLMLEDANDDFSSAKITYHPYQDDEKTYDVSLVYKYDANIKTMIDTYMEKIPDEKTYFAVTDMEVINFIYNGKGDVSNLIKYSGELKEYINYKNFSVDVRMGADDKFFTQASGIASFSYDNTFYGSLSGDRGAMAKHIIYVPNSTEDTKEALMQAAQKRIDEYIGSNKVTLSYLGTGIYDLYMNEYTTELEEYKNKLEEVNELLPTLTPGTQEYANAEMDRMSYESQVSTYEGYIEYFKEEWNNGEYTFLKNAEGDFYFNAKVFAGTENEANYNFIIIKDDSKMVNPTVKTSDVKTDITITPADNSIPLDTLIKADKLTSGTEYEKIITVLDVENHETFDLTLYSSSISKNITSGNFEVKIPISDSLKGKTLIVYYVNANNEIEEHEVTPTGNYAVFTTNHFSIYTLAEKNITATDDKTNTDNEVTPDAGEKDDTPKTGSVDVVLFASAIVAVISVAGIVLVKKHTKQ